MTDRELKAAVLDLFDRRKSLTNYELAEWESLIGNTAYFLRREREARDIKSVDAILNIEGAPV